MRYDDKDGQMYCNCPLCGKEVKYGKGAYQLRLLHRYGVHCCNVCWEGNWDGWHPIHREPQLLKILKENNLQIPERNEKGLLPRE